MDHPLTFMDFTIFNELTQWIMKETGLPESKAAKFAVAIGDTPETTEDGRWTATVDGRTITIDPFDP